MDTIQHVSRSERKDAQGVEQVSFGFAGAVKNVSGGVVKVRTTISGPQDDVVEFLENKNPEFDEEFEFSMKPKKGDV